MSHNKHYKYFSIKRYIRSAREGYSYIRQELVSLAYPEQVEDLEQDNPTSLNYGLRVFSKLLATTLLAGPHFTLDYQLDLKETPLFIAIFYIAIFSGFLVAALTPVIFLSVYHSLDDLDERVVSLLKIVICCGETINGSLGVFGLYWLVYKREFITQFMIYDCSSITPSRRFQRQTLARLYTVGLLCSLFGETTFRIISTYQSVRQPRFFETLREGQFFIIQCIGIFLFGLSSFITNVTQLLIPIMTCFLICSIADHIDRKFGRQISRLHELNAANCKPDNPLLTRVLMLSNVGSRKFMVDYAIDTLCLDWPEIVSELCFVRKPKNDDLASQDVRSNFTLGSRLFLHKNLLKTFSELKYIIKAYDKVFGVFHMLQISIHGFLIAQRIIIGAYESRSSESSFQILLIARVGSSFLSTMIWSVFILHKCKELDSKMMKLRSHIFRINLELNSSRSHELELIWYIYDQVDRLSREVNFKFAGKINYSKRCLLLLFTREVSLIMLFPQLIDIVRLIK